MSNTVAPNWRLRALCLDYEAETWFPTPNDTHTAERAKRICKGCPVITECDTEARRRPDTSGIWAAKRRFPTTNRTRDLKPCGTHAAYNRHLRNGETPCTPCREAERQRNADNDRRRYEQSLTKRFGSTP